MKTSIVMVLMLTLLSACCKCKDEYTEEQKEAFKKRYAVPSQPSDRSKNKGF